MSSDSSEKPVLLRVGEVARRVGKTVRALHLYEELDLIKPASRTTGGFRLYHPDTLERIGWIVKLQAIGFSLSEIQGFVREFEGAESGRSATSRVREEFHEKLVAVRAQIDQLKQIETDLADAIDYLTSCSACSETLSPDECGVCDHQGHDIEDAPDLFYTLARGVNPRPGGERRRAGVVKPTVVKSDS